jgi:RNA 2',3'-cyclic 3'-phosphodiesterase
VRLFVGIELPGEAKDELAGLIERLHGAAPDAKWVPRDNLHCTLSFLGEVAEERIAPIEDALGAAVADVGGPIGTSLAGIGAFPSARRARVLWAGLEDGDSALARTAERVASALEPHGFARDRRAWTPHLTLARFRVPVDATALLEAEVHALAFAISEVTLFQSRLARPSPAYTPLRRFRFGG